MSATILLCDYINPISDKSCRRQEKGAIVLKQSRAGWKIAAIGSQASIFKKYAGDAEIIDFSGHTALPGFFDIHFHWVQDDVRDMPKDSLLTWLSEYTWPTEAKFGEREFCQKKAQTFARGLIERGTLGGACFASIHGHSVDDALSEFIGDFIVGNVLMTMNSPEYLQTSEKEAWALVTKLAKEWGKSYAITPRFAPTTGPALMAKGAKLMREKRLFAQSHLSETRDEIDYVLSLFKKIKGFEKVKTYTEIYQKVGLLGPRVIMAHGIHLSAPELKLLAKTKTVIAHCPTSNAPVNERGLGSGLFDFAKTEKAGVRWALGSDIGAGPYLSMFDVMKSFVDQNKRAGVKGATYSKALFRATLAGAEALGQQKYSGNLEVGKWANFLLVKNPKNAQKTNAEEFLSLLHAPLKKDRQKSETLVAATFYRGEKIYQRESSKTTGQ